MDYEMKLQCERVILTMTIFLVTIPIVLGYGRSNSYALETIHLVMLLVCSVALFSYVDKPYSCFKVFHLFFFFFFGIAPILQFKNNVHILSTYFTEDQYLLTSTYLLAGLLVFEMVYYYCHRRFELSDTYPQSPEPEINPEAFTVTKKTVMFLISFAICVFYLYLNKFNIMAIVSRGGYESVAMERSSELIMSHVVRPLPLFLFLISMRLRNKLLAAFMFVFFYLSNPFTGMSRNAVAAMYFPVMLWAFAICRKRHVFVFSIAMALLVVFPFLNKFRGMKNFDKFTMELDFSQFLDMNFDSYSMFMRVLKDDIVTYGRQLLGVIFFWVPRSLWADKPVGSGWFVAHETHLGFGNISMPFVGEGYINFGTLGFFLFTILLAVVFAKLDANYWKKWNTANNFASIKYYMILGLIMFIMRGDLLSSFAYTIGYIVSFYFARYLLFRGNKNIEQ